MSSDLTLPLVIGLISLALGGLLHLLRLSFGAANRVKLAASSRLTPLTESSLRRLYHNPVLTLAAFRVGTVVSLSIAVIAIVQSVAIILASYPPIELPLFILLVIGGSFAASLCFILLPHLIIKQISAHHLLISLAVPAYVFKLIFLPLTFISRRLAHVTLSLFRIADTEAQVEKESKSENIGDILRRSIESEHYNKEEESEMKLFRNALDFSNLRVRDCLIPRTDIKAVDVTATTEEVIDTFTASGKTKLLVYEDDLDHILGYIHSADLYHHYHDWQQYLREIPIIPENMTANNAMKLFAQQRKTLALVVDEYGGTVGLVSIEDLVEEIFGEIEDEHDSAQYTARQIGEGQYLLSARLDIEKANELFDLELPESDDYMTVGGLILSYAQHIPKVNEHVSLGRYDVQIIKGSATKVELVKLTEGEKPQED